MADGSVSASSFAHANAQPLTPLAGRPRRSAAARAKAPLYEAGSDGEPFDADDDGDGDFSLAAGDLVEDYNPRGAQQTMWAQAMNASAAAAQAGHDPGDAAAAVMGLTTVCATRQCGRLRGSKYSRASLRTARLS